MFFQTSLDLWTENYLSDFYFFEDTKILFSQILEYEFPVVLSGPPKSGKKHFAFKVASIKKAEVFILNFMTDSEIIDAYDSLISLKSFAIFVCSDSFFASKDVVSRISALLRLNFSELSHNKLLDFIFFRLNRVGIILDDYLIKYSIARLPSSYFAVDSFICFLLSCKSISVKSLKLFFDSFK